MRRDESLYEHTQAITKRTFPPGMGHLRIPACADAGVEIKDVQLDQPIGRLQGKTLRRRPMDLFFAGTLMP